MSLARTLIYLVVLMLLSLLPQSSLVAGKKGDSARTDSRDAQVPTTQPLSQLLLRLFGYSDAGAKDSDDTTFDDIVVVLTGGTSSPTPTTTKPPPRGGQRQEAGPWSITYPARSGTAPGYELADHVPLEWQFSSEKVALSWQVHIQSEVGAKDVLVMKSLEPAKIVRVLPGPAGDAAIGGSQPGVTTHLRQVVSVPLTSVSPDEMRVTVTLIARGDNGTCLATSPPVEVILVKDARSVTAQTPEGGPLADAAVNSRFYSALADTMARAQRYDPSTGIPMGDFVADYFAWGRGEGGGPDSCDKLAKPTH